MPTTGPKGQPQFTGGDAVTLDQYLSSVANYSALVGSRIVGTASQRTAFSSYYGFAPYTGLEFFESDTSNTFFYSGTGWVGIRTQSGIVAFASGDFTASGGGFQASRVVNLIPNRFTSPPTIGLGVFTQAANDQHAGVANVTTSSFTLYYWRANQSATSVGWTGVPVDS